jgi:7-cyano-7-deazaguanine synthase
MPKPAVVLLSGGLDSATIAAIARDEGFELHALSIDYGQRHRFELEAAERVAAAVGVKQHIQQRLDMSEIGRSALTAAIDVPKHDAASEIAAGIPVTYVPARNTMMLSLALGWAEVLEAADIFIGVNAVDYSGYPDCRPEFMAAFERMANLATKAGVTAGRHIKIRTPIIEMSKAEIIKTGLKLGVDYSLTHSCYDPAPNGKACGLCDSCLLRKKGFEEAGVQWIP